MCICHGAKYDNEKDAFLQKADIFVFPTYYDNECFPLVLLEANGTKPPLHQHKRGRNTRYHRGRQNRLYRGKT